MVEIEIVVGGSVPAAGGGVVAETTAGAGVTTGAPGAAGAAGADVSMGAAGTADVACCMGADERPGTTGAAGELLWIGVGEAGVGIRVMVDGTAVTMTG